MMLYSWTFILYIAKMNLKIRCRIIVIEIIGIARMINNSYRAEYEMAHNLVHMYVIKQDLALQDMLYALYEL